jgi:hypothetical protein
MRVEMRYTEHKDTYYLSVFTPGVDITPHDNLPLSKRPEWLVNIVNLARLGDHFLEVHDPPPDRVLWFAVDSDFNLLDIDIFGNTIL